MSSLLDTGLTAAGSDGISMPGSEFLEENSEDLDNFGSYIDDMRQKFGGGRGKDVGGRNAGGVCGCG